jgi:hypothetical protein
MSDPQALFSRVSKLALHAVLAALGVAIFARAWFGAISRPVSIGSPLNVEACFALAGFALLAFTARAATQVTPIRTRFDVTAAASVFMIAIGAFAGTSGWYFLSDDFLLLRHAQAPLSALQMRLLMTTPGGDGHFGPLVYIFNALCWRAAGSSLAVWHWVGYAIHAVNCVLVYALAAALGYQVRARILSSALFAIHASRPEAVVWVTARFDLLSTLCVLAGLLCLLRGCRAIHPRRGIYFSVAILFMVSGMLMKESAFAFPLLAMLLIAVRCKNPVKEIPVAVVMCTVAAVVFIYRWTLFGGIGGYLDASGRSQFLSLTPLVAVKSLGLRLWSSLFFPINWTIPVSKLLAAVTGAYIVVLAVLFYSGATRRGFIASIGFTLLAALPIISRLLIPADMEGARILYLPSVGFCLLAGSLVERIPERAAYIAMAAILIFHGVALRHNLAPWESASRTLRQSCQAVAACAARGTGKAVVIGLPRKIDGAYVFANGFPECVEMQPGGEGARVELRGQIPQNENRAADSCVFAWDSADRSLRRIVP